MNHQINITINMPRQKTEAEQFAENSRFWAAAAQRCINHRIEKEKSAGNPLFQDIKTHAQFLEACEITEKRKRKELGFWKYYFGEP